MYREYDIFILTLKHFTTHKKRGQDEMTEKLSTKQKIREWAKANNQPIVQRWAEKPNWKLVAYGLAFVVIAFGFSAGGITEEPPPLTEEQKLQQERENLTIVELYENYGDLSPETQLQINDLKERRISKLFDSWRFDTVDVDLVVGVWDDELDSSIAEEDATIARVAVRLTFDGRSLNTAETDIANILKELFTNFDEDIPLDVSVHALRDLQTQTGETIPDVGVLRVNLTQETADTFVWDSITIENIMKLADRHWVHQAWR